MLAAIKLGAGPPCKIDIPITTPQILKSPELIAKVDCTGLPFIKNLLLMIDSNSTNLKIQDHR